MEQFGSGHLHAGVADALTRLKRAAERPAREETKGNETDPQAV